MPNRGNNAARFATMLRSLRRRISDLDTRFIAPVIDPLTAPQDYEVPVAAFCVLSHAAIEDFVEQLCLYTMSTATEDWLMNRRTARCLPTLMAGTKAVVEYEDFRSLAVTRPIDHYRRLHDHVRSKYSALILGNHGISVAYLRDMLYPLGIEFDDAPLLASVRRLADERGHYAHKIGARRPLPPEDARRLTRDCLRLAKTLAVGAATQLSG